MIHAWYVLIHTSLYWSVSGTYFDSIEYVLHVLYLNSGKYIPQYMSQYIHQYGAVVLVCIQYIPVRIDMYLVCIYIYIKYVLNHFQHDTFEYLIQYIPNTKACIGMYYGMYVYVSGSVSCLYHTVFDIFYDDTYHNTYQYFLQYLPIHDLIHTITAHNTYQYLSKYIPILSTIHTNIVINTCQYVT